MKYTLPLLLLFIFGCSKLETTMKWADTYVMYSLTDYFEFTSDQKKEVREDFKIHLNEVQKKDFPLISSTLSQFAEKVEKNEVQATSLDIFLFDLQSQYRKALQRFEPLAQKIVRDQVPREFKLFDKEFLSKFEKDLKAAKDPEKQERELKKKVGKIVDETIQSLTPEQEVFVDDYVKKTLQLKSLQLESRKTVYEKFNAVREEAAPRSSLVKTLFFNWESLQTESYLKAIEQNQKNYKELILKIFESLQPKQKTRLIQSLRTRADELKNLSK